MGRGEGGWRKESPTYPRLGAQAPDPLGLHVRHRRCDVVHLQHMGMEIKPNRRNA